jgi:hypothetical protein
MKAYIDREADELVTIGFDPKFAREQVILLGLNGWSWIEDDGCRAIPKSWEEIGL